MGKATILFAGLALLTPQVALGQPEAPPVPVEPPTAVSAEAAGDASEGAGGAGGADAKAGEGTDEGGAEAVDLTNTAPPVDATGAVTTATDADAEDDEWGLEERYPPPMVVPDFGQPQPEGYGREPHHDHRWIYHNLTAVRVNPLGLINRFRTGYRMQLSHRPEPAFFDSYGSVQLDTEVTPAYGVVGARLEVQPVALFNFWASYGFVGTFGSFGNTHSLPAAGDEYDDTTMGDTEDQDYSTIGQKAIISGLFQFGMAGLAVRSNVKAHWMSMDLRDGDRVFWDATLDVLVPNSGWVITNDADLLVLTDFDLKIGLRHTVTQALYRAEQRNDEKNINTPHHRIGPAFLYTFFEDDVGSTWNKPTVLLLAQWWVRHRYRTTEAPGLPYLVIGFVQEGDFVTSDKQ
jgi:hypothetical protein